MYVPIYFRVDEAKKIYSRKHPGATANLKNYNDDMEASVSAFAMQAIPVESVAVSLVPELAKMPTEHEFTYDDPSDKITIEYLDVNENGILNYMLTR